MSPLLKLVSSIPDTDLIEDMMEVDQDTTTGGSGGGSQNDLLRRVISLEDGHKLIIGKLDGIADGIKEIRYENEKRFGGIEGNLLVIGKSLEQKASSDQFEKIDGRLQNIPTTWSIVAIIIGMLASITAISFAISNFAISMNGSARATNPSLTAPQAPGASKPSP